MTTNGTVSEARGQEKAGPTKGQRTETKAREGRARWALFRKRSGTGAQNPAATTSHGASGDKSPQEVPLTPGQQQRRSEREHIEKITRAKRRARWTIKKRPPLTAEQKVAVAKQKAETKLERSTRVLVVAALAASVALIAFSIHALVQRNAFNHDLRNLVDQTQKLADQQATVVGQVQTTLDQLTAAETTRATQGEERLAKVEAATVAGFADVSQQLGKLDALTEAVNALARQDVEPARQPIPMSPAAFTSRDLTLPSGRHAVLAVPSDPQRSVLLTSGSASGDVNVPDSTLPIAEYLAARGCVVLRLDPPAGTAAEGETGILEGLDALRAQPEAAGLGVTLVVAGGEDVKTLAAIAETRSEVRNFVLVAPGAQAADPSQRLRQAAQVLGPIDEGALENLASWIVAQDASLP